MNLPNRTLTEKGNFGIVISRVNDKSNPKDGKMKRKIVVWLLLLAAIVVLWPLRESYPGDLIWAFDTHGLKIQEKEGRAILARVGRSLDQVERIQRFSEAAAENLLIRVDFARWHTLGKEQDDTTVESGEWYGPLMYEADMAEARLDRLLHEYTSAADQNRYFEFRNSHMHRDWGIRPYLNRSYVKEVAGPRLFTAGLLLLLAVIITTLPRAVNSGFMALFNARSLNVCSWVITLAVCAFTGSPALGQMVTEKAKKQTETIEAVQDEIPSPNPLTPPPPKQPRWEVKEEVFAAALPNNGSDHQYLTSVFRRISKRWSLAFINQLRQDVVSGNDLETPTFGARIKLGRNISVLATTGPEWDNTHSTNNRWKLKYQTSFLVFNFKSKRFSVMSLNRLPRETDSDYSGTHRHITAGRAGPMPQWVLAQNEVKWSRGNIVENYWGAMVCWGQLLKGTLKQWLGGFYSYLYYDTQSGWNVRFGMSKSFAFN